MIVVFVSAIALALALLASRTTAAERQGVRFGGAEAAVRRFAPVTAAVLSMLIVWIAWYSPIPKVHDENSYLLQADLFARGQWTAPSPPIPEFFEQPHVQVVPVVASKYPPGHALLLTPGALIGFPALMPLLLTGVTAALLVALTARVTNGNVAMLTWVVWIASPIVLRFQPGYFSEVTTTPLVLAAWWALLRWRETRRMPWILALALAIGWGTAASPFASSSPDGLERVAGDHDFAARGESRAAPLLDYGTDSKTATALAGFAGTLIVFAVGGAVARVARR